MLQKPFENPVSIADLPGHNFSVTPNTLTEEVVETLERQPFLPGVLIVQNKQLLGVITRLKLFERLGHRFGVELFLQKPISQLQDLIRTSTQSFPDNICIDEAIRFALNRPAPDAYDPIVMVNKHGEMLLLDMNLLLLAQSRAMASLSNVVGNLQQIDHLISSDRESHEIFNKILRLLCQVVPFHQAAILEPNGIGISVIASHGYPSWPNQSDTVLSSDLYVFVTKHRQAIYIPHTYETPAWKGFESLGNPVAWLGVPLLIDERKIGLLSISRQTERAFNNDERETVRAFAQRITNLLKRDQPEEINLGTQGHFISIENRQKPISAGSALLSLPVACVAN
jgi:hypothetical protein